MAATESYRDLYLQVNKNFAARAALFSLREKELHIDHPLLTFIVNFDTLAHFVEGAVAYMGMKLLDHISAKTIASAETAVKGFIAHLTTQLKKERLQPSSDPVEADKLVAQADQAFQPSFHVLTSANPPILEAALEAGRQAALSYLQDNFGIQQQDAAFLAQAVENQLRDAFAESKQTAPH